MFDYCGIEEAMQGINNSLEGVYGKAYNAILYLPSGSGEVIEDELGNYTFADVKTIEVQAYLWEDKETKYQDLPQSDLARTYMKGYCVSPNAIAGNHENYLKCKMKQDGQWVDGRFTFIDKVTTGLEENYQMATASGQKIQGYFERVNDSV